VSRPLHEQHTVLRVKHKRRCAYAVEVLAVDVEPFGFWDRPFDEGLVKGKVGDGPALGIGVYRSVRLRHNCLSLARSRKEKGILSTLNLARSMILESENNSIVFRIVKPISNQGLPAQLDKGKKKVKVKVESCLS
jgi:hypothetical protein